MFNVGDKVTVLLRGKQHDGIVRKVKWGLAYLDFQGGLKNDWYDIRHIMQYSILMKNKPEIEASCKDVALVTFQHMINQYPNKQTALVYNGEKHGSSSSTKS